MLKNFFLKFILLIVPTKILIKIEGIIGCALGKGVQFGVVHEINTIKKFLKKDIKIFFDIGSSYGNYTNELLKHFPSSNYYLFEPGELPYKHLLNKFKDYPNIKVYNYAISNNNSLKLLYYDKKGSSGASLYQRRIEHFNNKFDKFEEVKSIQLNTLFKNEFNDDLFKIDFCKIDVEGHEFAILDSFKNNFKKFKLIQFEFGGTSIDSRTYFQDFWYLLKDDFDIYRIGPTGPILIKEYTERDEIMIFANYLAVNKKL
jgi:FkbM family methyltransferase